MKREMDEEMKRVEAAGMEEWEWKRGSGGDGMEWMERGWLWRVCFNPSKDDG
jgi:hypothetical protein